MNRLVGKIKIGIFITSIIVLGISIAFFTVNNTIKKTGLCQNAINCQSNDDNTNTCNYIKDGEVSKDTITCSKLIS